MTSDKILHCALTDNAEIAFSDHGWTSRVYIVNRGEFVFKFPRFQKIKEEYALEVLAYRVAREVGGVSIPEVLWEHPERNDLGCGVITCSQWISVVANRPAGNERTLDYRVGTVL